MIDDPTAPGGDGAATAATAAMRPGSGSASGATLPVAPGDRFGRFRVDGMLGAGGMGVVFAAHDPMLDRQVAIKVMAQLADDTDAVAVEARMVREAKAMAQLSHPNVVRVYEAGATRAGVFLVMELIDGTTLARWLDQPRPWREVIARFGAAGRGLIAAHAAGMVHRDFKPANVLLGRDGRVLVSDFGLVSVGGDPAAASVAARAVDDGLDLSSGRLVGTPRYMAPEQHQRGPIDHRTDQWAFCAALWEALYRAHPFAADTAAILAMRVCVDDVAPPADDRGVPARIRAAVTRGLARDPAARFPSMAAPDAEPEPGRIAAVAAVAAPSPPGAVGSSITARAYATGGRAAAAPRAHLRWVRPGRTPAPARPRSARWPGWPGSRWPRPARPAWASARSRRRAWRRGWPACR